MAKKKLNEESLMTKKQFRRLVREGKKRRVVRRGESRKVLVSRARRFKGLAQAFGALPGQAGGAGAGRPKGSYKYQIAGRPVSVFAWRKFQAQRKRQLAQFQSQQNQRLAQKGFQPEQLQQLRQQRVVQQVQQGRPVMERNVADEELAFREHLARTTVTPSTQQILVALRRTQNKAKIDNIEEQRRHHERNLVGRSMNLMEAHKNLVPVRIDFTGVSEDNILSSPSLFKENPEDNILRTKRLNLMQTREAGNNLRFF